MEDGSLDLRDVVVITHEEKLAQALQAFSLQTDLAVEGADEKFEILVVPVRFDHIFSLQIAEELDSEDLTPNCQHKFVRFDLLRFRSLNKIK